MKRQEPRTLQASHVYCEYTLGGEGSALVLVFDTPGNQVRIALPAATARVLAQQIVESLTEIEGMKRPN